MTGAGSGIGLAIAQAFDATGARVALGDINTEAVEHATGALRHAYAGAVDVRDETSVRDFFAAAERTLGAVTIAVANAGVFPNCPVLDMPIAEWDRVIVLQLHIAPALSMSLRGGGLMPSSPA